MSHSVGEAESPCDLAGAVFAVLAAEFFTADGQPTAFKLRFKRQTQDDPFDEYVGEILKRRLPDGIRVLLSGKPLEEVGEPEPDVTEPFPIRQTGKLTQLHAVVSKSRLPSGRSKCLDPAFLR
jgi:hypothetical protein